MLGKHLELHYIYTQPSPLAAENNVWYVPFDTQSVRSKINWRLELWGLRLNYSDPGFNRRLNQLIQKINPDIIHCQFAYEGIKLWDNIKNKEKYTFLFSFRGYDSSYKLRNAAYVRKLKSILSFPNVHSHFVCNHLKENLRREAIPVLQSNVIYTGVDVDYFSPAENFAENHPRVFVQTGAFNDKKGQEITIRAFHLFLFQNPDKAAILSFIGSGKNLSACQALVKELRLEKFVFFLGKMEKTEILKHLRASDFFVHHSITASNGDQEGIPNALAEAMALNMPVLASKHAGIPELVNEHAQGILVNENDLQGYADSMASIFVQKRTPNNRNIILEKFSLQKHIQQFLAYYSNMLANKP